MTQDPSCLPNAYTLPQDIETFSSSTGPQPATRAARRPRCRCPGAFGDRARPGRGEDGARDAGFYVDVEMAASTQPPGTVIYQNPSAGTSLSDQHRDVTVADSTAAARSGRRRRPPARRPGAAPFHEPPRLAPPPRGRRRAASCSTARRHRRPASSQSTRPSHRVAAVEGPVDAGTPGQLRRGPSTGRAGLLTPSRRPSHRIPSSGSSARSRTALASPRAARHDVPSSDAAVGEVDVQMSRSAEHRRVARRRPRNPWLAGSSRARTPRSPRSAPASADPAGQPSHEHPAQQVGRHLDRRTVEERPAAGAGRSGAGRALAQEPPELVRAATR